MYRIYLFVLSIIFSLAILLVLSQFIVTPAYVWIVEPTHACPPSVGCVAYAYFSWTIIIYGAPFVTLIIYYLLLKQRASFTIKSKK